MVSRKGMAALFGAAVLTVGGWARADGPAAPTAAATFEDKPLLMDAPATAPAPTPRKGVMELLGMVGAADWLEKNNINIYGFAEGAYTHNFNNPDSKLLVGRVFDFEHDEPILSQFDLTIERTVDASKKQWDIGGRLEWIYGADAGLIHSNGLFDWYDSPRKPENQWDLNQAYVDVAIPVGNGLLVRAGKFVTLLGQETINPNGNALYSHSYLFGFAIPFTHTGVLASYTFNDNWAVTLGITRGWEQSLEDNNSAIDALGQVKWTINKEMTFLFNFVVGPERAGNSSDYRVVLDGVFTYAPNDKWSFAINGDYGWEDSAAADGDDAQWYGIAGYATYKFNDYFSATGRIEWFRDDDATRIGVATNFYEATLGLSIHPFAKDRWGQYLQLRPELRVDYCDKGVFNDNADNAQYSFGIDAIYNF